MSSKVLQACARSETLDRIRRRVINEMSNTRFDTRDEEIAYLLGVVDVLTGDIQYSA